MDINELKKRIKKAKIEVLKMCIDGGYGHPSSSFSCADIVGTLYYNVLNISKYNLKDDDRDRFIMSKNHAGLMTFPFLHDLGILNDEQYNSVMKEGSLISNHTNVLVPGMEFSGGALGIGFGVAEGVALAGKLSNKDYLVFCLLGDAECSEGSIWESALFAGSKKLNNLIVIIDNNNLGVTDYTNNMLSMEPLNEKWRSFGFDVERINGHDLKELNNVFCNIRTNRLKSTKPLCVICDTIKGKGVSFMENKLLWHGITPKGEYKEIALKELEEEE